MEPGTSPPSDADEPAEAMSTLTLWKARLSTKLKTKLRSSIYTLTGWFGHGFSNYVYASFERATL